MEKEIIYSSIVVVFKEETVKQRSIDLKGLIRPPFDVVGISGGIKKIISSPRDQIDIHLNRDRIQIRDISGEKPGKKPISKITLNILAQLGATPTAFGLNYGLSLKLKEEGKPSELIEKQILKTETLKSKFYEGLISVSIKLKYLKAQKICTLILEPYEDAESELHVDLNAHEDTESLPSEEILTKSLQDEYEDLLKLLTSLFE